MKRFIIGIALCATAYLGAPVAAHSESLQNQLERLNSQLEWDRFDRDQQRLWDQFDRDQERQERDHQRRRDELNRDFDRAIAFCDSISDPGRASACFKRIVIR